MKIMKIVEIQKTIVDDIDGEWLMGDEDGGSE